MNNPQIFTEPSKAIVALIFAFSIGVMLFSTENSADTNKIAAGVRRGVVQEVLSEREIQEEDVAYIGATVEQELRVEIEENGAKKQNLVTNRFVRVDVGDAVYVQTSFVGDEEETFEVVEISRANGLFWLSLFFIFLVLIVSGRKGLYALVGLVFSFAVIYRFIVPQILAGRNAVWVAILGAFLMLVVTLYTSHGMNKKSIAAFFGIAGTLLFVGLMAQWTVGVLHFTGYGAEEASFLKQEVGDNLNLIGLVVAGIIIAAIGI